MIQGSQGPALVRALRDIIGAWACSKLASGLEERANEHRRAVAGSGWLTSNGVAESSKAVGALTSFGKEKFDGWS
jgi:hypothetical protein